MQFGFLGGWETGHHGILRSGHKVLLLNMCQDAKSSLETRQACSQSSCAPTEWLPDSLEAYACSVQRPVAAGVESWKAAPINATCAWRRSESCEIRGLASAAMHK